MEHPTLEQLNNPDVTLYWSHDPGVFVNVMTGDIAKAEPTSPKYTGTVREWYETLVETVYLLGANLGRNDEGETELGANLGRNDEGETELGLVPRVPRSHSKTYTSLDVLTLFEMSSYSYKPAFSNDDEFVRGILSNRYSLYASTKIKRNELYLVQNDKIGKINVLGMNII
jgi:hypothetical protein